LGAKAENAPLKTGAARETIAKKKAVYEGFVYRIV
jgi:hypothetical protein